MAQTELLELERGLWRSGPIQFEHHLHHDCIFELPFLGKLGRNDLIAARSDLPDWQQINFSDIRCVRPHESLANLEYESEALSVDGRSYSARCRSIYTMRGGIWQLVQHQQALGNGPTSTVQYH